MKNQYEEKILEFYSEEENFKTMVSVVEAFPTVANHIIKGFWDQVKERLLTLAESRYSVGYSNSRFEDYVNKLWIFHESWKLSNGHPIIAVAFEGLHLDRKPWVGIFLNNEATGYNIEEIRTKVKMIPELENYTETNNVWWPKWRYLNPNITQRNEIVNLVSSNKSDIVELVAQESMTMFEKIQKEIEDILIKNKIQ